MSDFCKILNDLDQLYRISLFETFFINGSISLIDLLFFCGCFVVEESSFSIIVDVSLLVKSSSGKDFTLILFFAVLVKIERKK